MTVKKTVHYVSELAVGDYVKGIVMPFSQKHAVERVRGIVVEIRGNRFADVLVKRRCGVIVPLLPDFTNYGAMDYNSQFSGKYCFLVKVISRRKIIGIAGKKGVGKDTLGDFFVNSGYKKISFADNLKKGIKAIFMLDDDQLWGDRKEEIDDYWGVSGRQLMQTIGTDVFRNYLHGLLPECKWRKGDFWVKCFRKKCRKIHGNIVVTDVRFPEEVKAIKKMGGRIIYIKREVEGNDSHESENYDLEKMADQIVVNNGSIEDLHNLVATEN